VSTPYLNVHLAVCEGSALEAQAIRAALEWFNIRVVTHWIGRGNDLAAVLSGRDLLPDADHLLISCHGLGGEIVMPEPASGVCLPDEPAGNWGPETVRKYASLPSILVIGNGCGLGTPRMAKAFIEAGARAYIGPDGEPEASSSLFYVVYYYYELITTGCSERQAARHAATRDSQTAMYRWFDADYFAQKKLFEY